MVSQGIGLGLFLGIRFARVWPNRRLMPRVPSGLPNSAMTPVRLCPLVPILQCRPTAQMRGFLPLVNDRKLWDTYTGETLETLAHEHIVRSVDISSSQNLIATGGHEKRLRLFDIQQVSKPRDIGRHDGTIKSVVWDHKDASDNTIITSGDDKKVVWWDSRSVAPSADHKTEDSITSMEQSIDYNVITVTTGRTVLIFDSTTYVSRNQSCIIYSLSSRTLLKTLNFEYEVSSASVHPGFERLVVGSASDPWVRIHDYETGRQLGMDNQTATVTDISELIKGHHGPVHCVSYAPNGYLFATGSEVHPSEIVLTIGWHREITQRDN